MADEEQEPSGPPWKTEEQGAQDIFKMFLQSAYRGSAADLGLGPAGMELSAGAGLMTHAGGNLPKFATELLEKLRSIESLRNLRNTDVARQYLKLRYPQRFSKLGIEGAHETASFDPVEGWTNIFRKGRRDEPGAQFSPRSGQWVAPLDKPQIYTNSLMSALNNSPIADAGTLVHESQHVAQRGRALKGLAKGIEPEDLIPKDFKDPITGRQGRYVAPTNREEYLRQLPEKLARQAEGTARSGMDDFVTRAVRELPPESGLRKILDYLLP